METINLMWTFVAARSDSVKRLLEGSTEEKLTEEMRMIIGSRLNSDPQTPTKIVFMSSGRHAISELLILQILISLKVEISEVYFIDKHLGPDTAKDELVEQHTEILLGCGLDIDILSKYRFGTDNEEASKLPGPLFYVGIHMPYLAFAYRDYAAFEQFLLNNPGVRFYFDGRIKFW